MFTWLLRLVAILPLFALPETGQPVQPVPPHVDANRALGVACTHCHVKDAWSDATKPEFGIARNMIRMVAAVNRRLEDVGPVTCWTCHAGEVKPSRLPPAALDAELARWPAELPEDRKLAMAVYDVTLGVTCDHCHSADWKAADKAPMKMVQKMTGLFDEFPKYMPAAARTQCFMCHKGRIKPQGRTAGIPDYNSRP